MNSIPIYADVPAVGRIIVGEEVIQLLRCPDCGAQAAQRNTPEGWLVFCAKGCNGRQLSVGQGALLQEWR